MIQAELYDGEKYLGDVSLYKTLDLNLRGENMYYAFTSQNLDSRVLISHKESDGPFILLLKALDSLKKNGLLDGTAKDLRERPISDSLSQGPDVEPGSEA